MTLPSTIPQRFISLPGTRFDGQPSISVQPYFLSQLQVLTSSLNTLARPTQLSQPSAEKVRSKGLANEITDLDDAHDLYNLLAKLSPQLGNLMKFELDQVKTSLDILDPETPGLMSFPSN